MSERNEPPTSDEITLIKREVRHVRTHMLTGEQARDIFRTEVLKVNSATRIAVAVIGGLVVGGVATANAIANHDAMALEMRCQKVTTGLLIEHDRQQSDRDKELVRETIREIDVVKGARP